MSDALPGARDQKLDYESRCAPPLWGSTFESRANGGGSAAEYRFNPPPYPSPTRGEERAWNDAARHLASKHT